MIGTIVILENSKAANTAYAGSIHHHTGSSSSGSQAGGEYRNIEILASKTSQSSLLVPSYFSYASVLHQSDDHNTVQYVSIFNLNGRDT